jgi:hypothetical protein
MSEGGGKLGSREHEYLRILHIWEEVDPRKTTMPEQDGEEFSFISVHINMSALPLELTSTVD